MLTPHILAIVPMFYGVLLAAIGLLYGSLTWQCIGGLMLIYGLAIHSVNVRNTRREQSHIRRLNQ